MAAKDHLLHFPYQSYDYLVDFLRQASEDDAVEEIWISLYRVADDSEVVNALIEAAGRGKTVSAFVEVQGELLVVAGRVEIIEKPTPGVADLQHGDRSL